MAEVGSKGVAKVGRAAPVPHLPRRERTTVRGQACVGSKDETVRAKWSKGGCPAGRCGHRLSCSLSTGVPGSSSGTGEWTIWKTGPRISPSRGWSVKTLHYPPCSSLSVHPRRAIPPRNSLQEFWQLYPLPKLKKHSGVNNELI